MERNFSFQYNKEKMYIFGQIYFSPFPHQRKEQYICTALQQTFFLGNNFTNSSSSPSNPFCNSTLSPNTSTVVEVLHGRLLFNNRFSYKGVNHPYLQPKISPSTFSVCCFNF